MKIDTTAISGYAEMSAEEKLAALEAYEFEAPKADESEEVKKLKELLDMGIVTEEEFQKKKKELLKL
jgi:hypothetical protein